MVPKSLTRNASFGCCEPACEFGVELVCELVLEFIALSLLELACELTLELTTLSLLELACELTFEFVSELALEVVPELFCELALEVVPELFCELTLEVVPEVSPELFCELTFEFVPESKLTLASGAQLVLPSLVTEKLHPDSDNINDKNTECFKPVLRPTLSFIFFTLFHFLTSFLLHNRIVTNA